MMKKLIFIALITLSLLLLASCGGETDTAEGGEGSTTAEETVELLPAPSDVIEEGIYWPEDQILPWFAEPVDLIDCVNKAQFEGEEQLAVVALQGLVNKTLPRLAVLESSEEGELTWIRTTGKRYRQYQDAQIPTLLKKYIGEAEGVVMYTPARSNHYYNLALTAASLKNAIPMTPAVYNKWRNMGVELPPIVEDLTTLTYTTAEEIYTHLYNTYWQDCTKRLLISQSPDNFYNLHDLSSAVGAATVYLDCTNAAEKAVFSKFLSDMKPGEGVVLGWFTTERSGISTVASHGLTTVPADFFNNATVYSGVAHTIKTAGIPDMPELENKVYVMAIVSDGDNIQYNQHAMYKFWNMSGRGSVPLSWTISPALVDIAPNILNYFYDTATDNDCLICGPSGYGYVLLQNTLWEVGAPLDNFMNNVAHFTRYVKLTDRYLGRSGLRVVTVWDNASDSQLSVYTRSTDYLWGLTVHDWNNSNAGLTQVVNGTLVQQLAPCYSVSMESAYNTLGGKVKALSNDQPHFIALQFSVWEDFSPAKVAELEKKLQAVNPNVEFVRADHYYALYNQANGLDFDLSILPELEVSAEGHSRKVAMLTDGITTNCWEAEDVGEKELIFAFGDGYDLSELRLYHASEARKSPSLNTVSYAIEVSSDGVNYTRIETVEDNTEGYNKLSLTAKDVTHVKIVILDAGADGVARLADVEFYGRVHKAS